MRARNKAGRTRHREIERKKVHRFSSVAAAAAAAVAVLFSTGLRGACVFLVGANTVVEEEAYGILHAREDWLYVSLSGFGAGRLYASR